MQGVRLFDLASKQAQWLSVRQAAVAGNVANANTPGYAAMEVESFGKVLSRLNALPVATQPGHLLGPGGDGFDVEADQSALPLVATGNSVVIEEELVKAGEVRRAFELNTGIVRSFNRMLAMTVKG